MRAKSLNSGDRDLIIYLRRTMEVLWLTAAFVVPLVVAPTDWMISYIQLPKLVLLRSLVAGMVMLWSIEWALSASADESGRLPLNWRSGWEWLREEPSRWVIAAASGFLFMYLFSTVLSASVSISVWGGSRVWDGYSLYNMLTYFLLFLVITTHLRSKAQLWRLLGAVAAAGGGSSLIALFERLHWIPWGTGLTNELRVESTFGNPIFLASFLVMAIPLTAGLALALQRRFQKNLSLVAWFPLLSLQFLAIAFTLSRGPLVGLAAGLVTFLALGLIALDMRTFLRAGVVIGLSAGLAFVALRAVPDRPQSSAPRPAAQALEERVFTIYPQVASGGVSNRIAIWRTSSKLITERPWFANDSLTLSALRPFIGYGPDLFGYVFPLEALPGTGLQLHAHNEFLHKAVELGYLGVLSYAALLAAFYLSAAWLLLRNRKAYGTDHKLVLLALVSALAGRAVEQMVGLARIGDFTLFWIALAIFVALPAIMDLHGRQREASERSTDTGTGRLIPRVALALVVVVALLWLMAARNVNYFRADVSAARAYKTDDIAEAIAFMDRAIALAPDRPDYYRHRADILKRHMSDSDDIEYRAGVAEMIYADRFLAAQVDPLAGENILGQANAAVDLNRLGYKGKGQEAVQLYQKLIDLVPNLSEFHILLQTLIAIAYVDIGQPEIALEVLEKALAVDSNEGMRSKALYVRGAAYYELGSHWQAIESLNESLALNADMVVTAQAHFLLSRVYQEIGELALSEQHRREYRKLARMGDG